MVEPFRADHRWHYQTGRRDPLMLIPGRRRADSSVVCFIVFNLMEFVSTEGGGPSH